MHTGIDCWRVWWKASKTIDVRQCSFTIFSFSNSSEMLNTLLAVLPLQTKCYLILYMLCYIYVQGKKNKDVVAFEIKTEEKT